MTDTVSYRDRFKWFKRMQAQPKSVLTADTKVVLGYLFAAMDQNQDTKTIHYRTIAEGTGLSEDGVRGCFKRAKQAGFVSWIGKGGFVRTADGVTGLANTFSMQWPSGLANTGDTEARADEPAYPVQPAALPGLAEPITRAGQHTNSSLSSSPLATPLSSPANAGRGMDEEEKHAPLPIASFDDRVSWSTYWPESEPIPYWETHSEEGRWTRIINVAFDLLGWANKGDNREAFRPIHEALNGEFEYRGALLLRYTAGQLTTADLANVLAVAGIAPPLPAAQENSNEEAA